MICPSLKFYRSRLMQSRAQENNSVSITWLGTAGVLVSDGATGILIDPYVSRFGFFKIAMGLHLQPIWGKAVLGLWPSAIPILITVLTHHILPWKQVRFWWAPKVPLMSDGVSL
jgi:hypothetical protein